MWVVTLLILLVAERTSANPEPENGVIGQPEVRCGATSIMVVTHTAAPFAGRLYVQGEAESEGCVRKPKGATDSVEFELRFGECGMRRQRTLSPRGVTYSFTLVVSFHPVFVTGTDRGFNVRCFFLESVKSLEAEVDVGRLTTSVIEKSFDLPACTYSIHEASPTGPPVKYARVGDAVAHVWNCGEEAAPAYGMLIHSCYVDDGAGKRFELIDDRGCGVDRVLLPQIEYERENLVASAKSSIFKYADKIQVFFTCTVQLCFKKDGGCDGLTPPQCDGAPHPPHPDHPVLLIPDHDHHEHPDHHHERPPRLPEAPEGHRGPEGHHGPPPRPEPRHRSNEEDEEEEERRPHHPRFIPRGGPPRPDSREHRGPPPPHFPPRHGPSRGEEREERPRDGPREHGPPHRPRDDRPDSREHRGQPRGDRDGPRGRFGPPRNGPRDEDGERAPPPPPRGLFPADGLPDEIKNAFESKFAPPSKEFFGPMDRDSDVRLDSPLNRGGSSAEGEKLLTLKSNSTTERKRPEVRVLSGSPVSSSTANSLDAALQEYKDKEEYSDDLDDIEALLNASSDATSEPLRYRTDFASSTLSNLFEDETPSTSPSPTSTSTEQSTTTREEEEEPMIKVSTMTPILKDAPPPSSTQYPFSSTGAIFEPTESTEGKASKQVGGDVDRMSRDSEARKKLETDLSVDVIVLPFEEDKPSTPSTLHSPPSLPSRPVLCLSAVGSSLLLSAVLLGLLVVAAVSFTLARRGRGSMRGPEAVTSKRLDLF